jgi:glycerol uptake facilitator-like aquaporin
MMSQAFPGVISHTAAVTAPALTVMAIILFMGKISGAHLNPAVSIAFALRGRGGGKAGAGAAQGELFTEVYESGES